MPHVSDQHAQHDPLLVVSFAAGDLTDADRDLAASLVAECVDCASLHDDILAIARATAAVPAATRPRDFQLSPEQAAHLRPAGWRRFVAAFGSPRFAMTRQLGVGLTTLGLAGLLVSVLPTVQMGAGSAAAPAAPNPPQQALSATDNFTDAGVEAAASAAAAPVTSEPGYAVTGGQPSASPGSALVPLSSPQPDRVSASNRTTNDGTVTAQGTGAGESAPAAARDLDAQAPSDGQGVSLVLVASAIFLAAGIALLIARRLARSVPGN